MNVGDSPRAENAIGDVRSVLQGEQCLSDRELE
jgi:hypothetical protein